MISSRQTIEQILRAPEVLLVPDAIHLHDAGMSRTAAAAVLGRQGIVEERHIAAWQDTLGAYALWSHIIANEDYMNDSTVITFSNLRQRTRVAGELAPVTAKAKPFASSQGVLRKVSDLREVGEIAKQAGKRTLDMLKSAEL